MEKHDVVVIGGGHNGLVAAAYLAKAGLDVCVVEGQDKCGGGVITEELTVPGFKHDTFSIFHAFIQANPLISQDELKLKSKYGLKYISCDPAEALIFPDDRVLVIYQDVTKTCESISQFSERDAEAYPRYLNTAKGISMILGEMFSPPPTFGNMISFLEASEEGRGYLKLILDSALDIAEDWFESEQMKAMFLLSAGATEIPPDTKGTGQFAAAFAGEAYLGALPEGGSGALTRALMACLGDNGVTIRVSSPVKAIKVETDEARGIVLETGEEIMATKAVISSLNVKQLFLQMLKPDELPVGFPEKVGRIRQSAYTIMKQDIALNEALKYKAGGDTEKALVVRITPSLEDLLKRWEGLAAGIPQTSNMHVAACTPTLFDPTRAPEGKHTLYFFQDEPYFLKDGGPSRWDEIKQEVADAGLENLRKHTTNMGPENILGRFVRSPLDFERCNPAWIAGDANHIGVFLSQMFANRPLPGLGNYRTPVKKLYMCGPSTHPGPVVNGGSRAAMPVIMGDLGIDFKRVIAR